MSTTTQSPDRTPTAAAPARTPAHPWLVVTVREVVVKLTDRSFVLSTALMVVLIVAGVGISAFMGGRSTTFDVGAVDTSTGTVAQGAQQLIAAGGDDLQVTSYDSEDALRAAVLDEEVDAGLVQGQDGFTLIGNDEIDPTLQRAVSSAVEEHVLSQNAEAAGTTLAELREGATVSTTLIGADAGRATAAQVAGFIFAFLFYMSAIMFGMTIANSVLEEKQNRVVEILATAIPVRQILYGKVLGNSLLAFGQIALFGVVGLIGVNVAGMASDVGWLLSASGWFAAFFVAGFIALAAVWAVLGSLASRSEDLQSSTGPVIGVIMVALFAGLFAQGMLLQVASFVPVVSSVAMPIRLLAGEVPLWQPVVSLLLTLVAAGLLIRLGERIYQRAVMHSGAAISWRQAFRLES
ncbi:ABC transporter permease [Ruania albidiflava]|uniref:ABC transporter permease n=1 Tax=Ruania albidiflava TaxID=366586 RepID=UPI0003B7589F|nr:ABC transporter permease [Ruania albidiflava]